MNIKLKGRILKVVYIKAGYLLVEIPAGMYREFDIGWRAIDDSDNKKIGRYYWWVHEKIARKLNIFIFENILDNE